MCIVHQVAGKLIQLFLTSSSALAFPPLFVFTFTNSTVCCPILPMIMGSKSVGQDSSQVMLCPSQVLQISSMAGCSCASESPT